MAQVLRSAFSAPMDDLVLRFVASVDDDRHLLRATCAVRSRTSRRSSARVW
jgi:hypothetical protein